MPRKAAQTTDETNPSPEGAAPAPTNGTESVAGYFRKIFEDNPRLLKERSNEALYERWLADHPGYTEVPNSVRTGLQNIKSVLRHKKGVKGKRREKAPPAAAEAPVQQARPKSSSRSLDRLEGMIDECLFLARELDATGLETAIGLLRNARNEVIRQASEAR